MDYDFFEEYDDSDLDDIAASASDDVDEDATDEFDDDDEEEFDVDLDDLNDTLNQLGDDDFDFDSDEGDDFDDEFGDDEEDQGLDSDVTNELDDDDDEGMEDAVKGVPEVELSPDEKQQASDEISSAVPAMLIKTEMDTAESVNFFSGDEVEIALDEGLLSEAAVDYFMDIIRNVDPDLVTETTQYGSKTIVRFSKQALLARIKGICVVKCARAHHDPDVPKYRKICMQRKFYRARMKKKYNREAEKQARIIVRRMQQSKSPAIKKLSEKVSNSGETKK